MLRCGNFWQIRWFCVTLQKFWITNRSFKQIADASELIADAFDWIADAFDWIAEDFDLIAEDFEKFLIMRIDIITVLPEMLESPLGCSILKRAQDKGLAELVVHNLRDYTTNRHRKVDDYPFGGDAGMVMQVEPVDRCIAALKAERNYDEVIFTAPDGEVFNQRMANQLSMLENIIILCGHYKGIDYRIREHLITREISVGDYVLTGGELPAAIIADAIVRLIPGAIGDEQSALTDSFQDNLLEPPIYTRPADYNGWRVPDILLSGHEAKIAQWKHEQAVERTRRLRPDLLDY